MILVSADKHRIVMRFLFIDIPRVQKEIYDRFIDSSFCDQIVFDINICDVSLRQPEIR